MDFVIEFLKKPIVIILIGAIIATIGGLITALGTYLNNKNSSAKSSSILTGVKTGIEIGTNTNATVLKLNDKIESQAEIIDTLRLSNSKLIGQNTELLDLNIEIVNSNKILSSQNEGMLKKIDQYQYDIEERNKTIEQLKDDLVNVKDYTYYATRNHVGLERVYFGGDFTGFDNDLSSRMNLILYQKGSNFGVIRNPDLLPKINEVIEKYPKFPFSYWAKYFLERQYFPNSKWKECLKKCIDILEITTKIEGHHEDHDLLLKLLNNDWNALDK
ncbi:hypothetical protein [Arsenicibacter rosenii]|uniref:Uncharacterized protein n=1 Tax=Arsenicibacter rosenii TaxID=1750698 RepID=A0A1S2VP17_9BACT|nr:hypothetical protein [Arsenicibacter rosenii]OIN59965.1 hypothetical protein BLX24_09010 [Arsenicibacter rosenii]